MGSGTDRTAGVSDGTQTGLTVVMLVSLAVAAAGVVIGRFDISAAGVVGLVGAAWVLGMLARRPE